LANWPSIENKKNNGVHFVHSEYGGLARGALALWADRPRSMLPKPYDGEIDNRHWSEYHSPKTRTTRRSAMRTRLAVRFFALLAVLAFFSVTAIAADMLPGTWKLNVSKSKFSPGPPPQSNTVKIESTGGGIKLVADGVDSQGRKTHNEYTATLDGKDSPMKPMLDGKPNPNAADTISWKKIDDYTYEVTNKFKGKMLTMARHVISKDGKTRTVTTTGTNAQGQTVNTTTVFEKE
jgi:hypothetical protein